MRRADLVLVLAGAIVVAGCGGEDRAVRREATGAASTATPPPAETVPETDFERYMLGDLPGPGTLVRDPFGENRPPEVVVPEAAPRPRRIPAPSLRGIIRSNGRFVALFDRGTAGEGETVRGWTVHAIDERSVTLQRRGRTVRRTL